MKPLSMIIAAAGAGTRLGLSCPKAFADLGGVSVLQQCCQSLTSSDLVATLIVMVPSDWLEAARAQILQLDLPCEWDVAVGGATRQQSVKKGLTELERLAPSVREGLVGVHDAARCFVPPEVVARVTESASRTSAAVAAVPMVDTLRGVDDQSCIATEIDRSKVWAIQTPQIFSFALLKKAFSRAFTDYPDESTLVRSFHPVQVAMGSSNAFKITTPDDLLLARALAAKVRASFGE